MGFGEEEPHPASCEHCWVLAGRSPILRAVSTVRLWQGGAPSCPLSQELQRAAVPAGTGPHGVRGARPGLGRGAPGVRQAWWQVGLLLPALRSSLLSSGVVPLLGFFLLCLGSISLCLRSISLCLRPSPPSSLSPSSASASPRPFCGPLLAPSSCSFSAGCVHEGPTVRPVGCVTTGSGRSARGPSRESSHGTSVDGG